MSVVLPNLLLIGIDAQFASPPDLIEAMKVSIDSIKAAPRGKDNAHSSLGHDRGGSAFLRGDR
jgi:hypothetical protein